MGLSLLAFLPIHQMITCSYFSDKKAHHAVRVLPSKRLLGPCHVEATIEKPHL